MWKINAGRGSAFARDFIDHGVVAIGWAEAGNPVGARSKAEILRQLLIAYPDHTDRQNEVAAGQIWRFLSEIEVGDQVVTYDPNERVYHLGTIAGEARQASDGISRLPTQRSVQWTHRVPRDSLSKAAKGKLGAILTLFKIDRAASDEINALARGETASNSRVPIADQGVEVEAVDDPFAAIEDQAVERIKDRLLALDWDDMQEMVAALLRALGYRTIVSPSGPDRGKDIVASRDGFGFESPRIVVEVKHRRGPMGAPEIRAFLGGRHPEDRGLYVSTGGFTKEAHFEAERASNVMHLMTLDGLAKALVANYDNIDGRGRALLPLTRVYWPA